MLAIDIPVTHVQSGDSAVFSPVDGYFGGWEPLIFSQIWGKAGNWISSAFEIVENFWTIFVIVDFSLEGRKEDAVFSGYGVTARRARDSTALYLDDLLRQIFEFEHSQILPLNNKLILLRYMICHVFLLEGHDWMWEAYDDTSYLINQTPRLWVFGLKAVNCFRLRRKATDFWSNQKELPSRHFH